jgi:hypothetical protein
MMRIDELIRLWSCDNGHVPITYMSREREACPLCYVKRERALHNEEIDEHARNILFYRDIITRIGNMFGESSRVADDGKLHDSVLALKVPELVEQALEKLDSLTLEGVKVQSPRRVRISSKHNPPRLVKKYRSRHNSGIILAACTGFMLGIFKSGADKK